jgi:2,4-dienoyl-CoA reductase-like NADH-dependent reductase (Old Yellow Enzyme family)
VVRAIRSAVGEDFPICIRLSQFKVQDFTAKNARSPKEMEEWLLPLIGAGANLLHCTQRRFWVAEFPEVDGDSGLNFAGWAKKLTGARTISGGSVGLANDFTTVFEGRDSAPASLDGLIERLEREEFDLVSVGRALIADPSWTRKVLGGHDDELIGCSICVEISPNFAFRRYPTPISI